MIKLILRILHSVNKKNKKRLILLQILSLLTSLLNVLTVVLIIPFTAILTNQNEFLDNKFFKVFFDYSKVFPNDDMLLIFSSIIITLFVITSLLSIAVTYYNLKWTADLQIYFSSSLYNYYINKKWLFHANTPTKDSISKLHSDTQRLSSQIISPVLDLITNIILTLSLFSVVLLINFKIALILIVVLAFTYLFFYVIFRKTLKHIGKDYSEANRFYMKYLHEGFSSIRDTIIFKKQKFYIKNFHTNLSKVNILTVKEQFLSKLPRNIIEIVTFVILIAAVYSLVRIYEIELIKVGPLIAFYGISAIKILPALQKIFNSFAVIRVHKNAFDTIEKDLLSIIKKNDLKISEGESEKISFNNEIELKDVSFLYPGTKNAGVFNVNLKVPIGSIVGISGKTGSGKSTILDLMLGLLEPDSGELLVDNKKINKKDITEWQENLSYVPQQFFIGDDQLINNIAFGENNEEIDKKKIEECLKEACLEEFQKNLSINVGDRGERISGGQRQRVAIARALYKRSNIIFLDEATSALDSYTEKKILQNIRDSKHINTIIVISHRVETLKMCNFIYHVSNGKVEKIKNLNDLEKKYEFENEN
jgi:ATP-binding cassette, subfamily B, bacterial PglK